MATLTQKHRLIAVNSPLGEDVLAFYRMVVREQLGRLFECQLELLSDAYISHEDILGQPMVVRMNLIESEGTRYFHGFVTRFGQAGWRGRYMVYNATLSPYLWFLTRTADCRIFQEQTVPDIIKAVFRENGFTDFQEILRSERYQPWEYCVQYRETDFNFVSRLMEQAGIYYYFKHEENKHILVLCDSYSSHDPGKKIPFLQADVGQLGVANHIFDFSTECQVQPGAYVLNDFDFKKIKYPTNAALKSILRQPEPHALAEEEIFDYPGKYEQSKEGDTYAETRLEELQAQHEVIHARGNTEELFTGALFTLTDHPSEQQNREYLVTSASYEMWSEEYQSITDRAHEGPYYRCQFTAIDAKRSYRSPRATPKSMVQGPQTAIVVGPSGEEIWTDKYGRVKCQFHWDRYGQSDENSSCWIRVSHPWAGKNWGAVAIPRIGQEVIVDFLEGDPDRPIITGRVYNNDQMPPYGLPDGKVVSGIKSRSTKGGGGYNELIMDDTKNKELIRIHAQYDMDTTVEHDQKNTIINDRTTTVNKGNDTLIVETGKRAVTVKKNSTHVVQAGSRIVEVTGGDYVAISTDNWVKHKGVAGVAVHGQGEGVGILGEPMVSIEGKSQVTVEAKDGVSIKAALVDISDKEIQIHGTQITLQCGGSTIQMDASKIALSSGSGQLVLDATGATLKGALVKIN